LVSVRNSIGREKHGFAAASSRSPSNRSETTTGLRVYLCTTLSPGSASGHGAARRARLRWPQAAALLRLRPRSRGHTALRRHAPSPKRARRLGHSVESSSPPTSEPWPTKNHAYERVNAILG